MFIRNRNACVLLLLSAAAAPAQYLYTTFDAPGAAFGTYPSAINNSGDVVGWFRDVTFKMIGFIRYANGSFATFDPTPGCSNCELAALSDSFGINDKGEVAGSFTNPPQPPLGYFRNAAGLITTFPGPNGSVIRAVTGLTNSEETIVSTTTGIYLYTINGAFTPLTPPSSIEVGATIRGLNNSGQVLVYGAIGVWIWDIASGAVTSPLRCAAFPYFQVSRIADNGVFIGVCFPGGDEVINYPDGSQTFFPMKLDPTHTGDDGVQALNSAGEITGFYLPQNGGQNRGFVGVPSTDTTPPNISFTQVLSGPPQQALFSVVDPVAGVFSISPSCGNCTATVDSFVVGQKTPVIVRATKTDQTQSATVEIQAMDSAGNEATFDPAFLTVLAGAALEANTLSFIPPAENILSITNGNPGLDSLQLDINGRIVAVQLTGIGTRTINLKAWLKPERNTISFSGTGAEDSSASIVLRDAGNRIKGLPGRSFLHGIR